MISLDPIRPYLPLIYGGAVLLIVGVLWWQNSRIGYWKSRVSEKDRAILAYAGAQETNLASIKRLQDSLDNVLGALRLEREAAIAATVEAQRQVDAINDELEATKRELADVYERSPSARNWGAVGVDADVADRLPSRTHH